MDPGRKTCSVSRFNSNTYWSPTEMMMMMMMMMMMIGITGIIGMIMILDWWLMMHQEYCFLLIVAIIIVMIIVLFSTVRCCFTPKFSNHSNCGFWPVNAHRKADSERFRVSRTGQARSTYRKCPYFVVWNWQFPAALPSTRRQLL